MLLLPHSSFAPQMKVGSLESLAETQGGPADPGFGILVSWCICIRIYIYIYSEKTAKAIENITLRKSRLSLHYLCTL